jgi:hypothetical protein
MRWKTHSSARCRGWFEESAQIVDPTFQESRLIGVTIQLFLGQDATVKGGE